MMLLHISMLLNLLLAKIKSLTKEIQQEQAQQ